jgi:hypothetical protein
VVGQAHIQVLQHKMVLVVVQAAEHLVVVLLVLVTHHQQVQHKDILEEQHLLQLVRVEVEDRAVRPHQMFKAALQLQVL